MTGRPKTDNPAVAFPLRLPASLKADLEALAKRLRRKPTELVRMLIEDALAADMAAHPAPPAGRTGAAG